MCKTTLLLSRVFTFLKAPATGHCGAGPALLLYQLGPARLHYCAVLLTVLERWVAPCLLLSLSAFCILGNNTLQTLEFS